MGGRGRGEGDKNIRCESLRNNAWADGVETTGSVEMTESTETTGVVLEFGMYASVRDALPTAFRFEVPLLSFSLLYQILVNHVE